MQCSHLKLTLLSVVFALLVSSCAHQARYEGSGTRMSGVASWYGPGLHGRRTASGERFNMYELTAAHRTLPMGSRVRVHCPSTGKDITVRINDRGPVDRKRLIDLSYQAAKSLGIIQAGLTQVEIEVLGK